MNSRSGRGLSKWAEQTEVEVSKRKENEKKASRDLRGKPRCWSRSRVLSGVSDLQANGDLKYNVYPTRPSALSRA
ncbi:MAG: hypothetical protein GY820_47740 [Gammaproteobacteria bacterium]|nr:hypothetical protein [Gammaproteobacteria bacterium]